MLKRLESSLISPFLYITMESNSSKFEMGSLAEVTLSYVYKGMVKDRPKITSSEDVYKIAMQVMDQNIIAMQEQFLAIYLNRSCHAFKVLRKIHTNLVPISCPPFNATNAVVVVVAKSVHFRQLNIGVFKHS